MPTGPDDVRFQGRPEVVGLNPISLPGGQSARHPGRRRAVDPKATEGRTAQKFVGFGINHSLTILRSTVAALFSHSYRPPWGIAAFLPDDRGSRGSGRHFQHQHSRGSCFRRVSSALIGILWAVQYRVPIPAPFGWRI